MIKEKLVNAGRWIKRKVKWLLIATGMVGLAYAAGVGMPDKTFENLPNVAKEQGLYRITFDEYSEVEIKDQDMPELILRKWGDETFIKISYPDFTPVNPKQDKGKLKWVNGDKEVHLYPLEPREFEENGQIVRQLEDGGFEFDIIYKEKPVSPITVLNIETKGLKFYYQPELTQKEKDEGSFRPENVVGSYAVYHESKQGNYEALGGKNYMAGKAFHIYRPQMIDANGWKVWGELNIDVEKGKLYVEMPIDFWNNAVYPVSHAAGLNFGYEGPGSSHHSVGPNNAHGSVFTSPADTTTGISITFYVGGGPSERNAKGFITLNSDLLIISNGIGNTVACPTADGERTSIFGTAPTITPNTAYVLWVVMSGTIFLHYDAGDADQGHIDHSNSYASPIDPTDATHDTKKYYIYATYEAEAPPSERRIMDIE